jgi:hypothetical protein
MSFALDAIVDGDTTSLTDGAPFKLRRARGMAGPPVRRVTARGPAQHGDTDLGYRLQPRDMELEIGFHADTHTALDGYRDTLTNTFKPLTATPINLRVTRDGSIVRQIDCYTVGPILIDLVPEERAAKLHRAVVRLRAPDPTYYDPVPGTVSVSGTPTATFPGGISPTWYLAGGAIGTARVLVQGTAPAVGEAWSYTGTVSDYTLAFKTSRLSGNSGVVAQWGSTTFDNVEFSQGNIGVVSGGLPASHLYDVFFFTEGTANYYLRSGTAGIPGMSGSVQLLRGTVANQDFDSLAALTIFGTARSWRNGTITSTSSQWGDAIPIYALYSPGLSEDEIETLETFMSPVASGTLSIGTSVTVQGDMPIYPEIRITGPITDPSVRHTYSGKTLTFSHTIGAGTTWIIDTRHGYKTVLEGTVNRRGELTSSSDLAEWHLSADYPQGINAFQLSGQSTGTATKLEIVYHHRYSSY